MDPSTNLTDRLRQQPTHAGSAWPHTPPSPQDWLRFWNGESTNLGGLRNFEHWLSRSRRERTRQT